MTLLNFPLPYSPYAIILNGQRECFQQLQNAYHHYQKIIVCDGAWFDVVELLGDKQDFNHKIIALGDGDSIKDDDNFTDYPKAFIHIKEQNSTDFEKAITWLITNHPLKYFLQNEGENSRPFSRGGLGRGFIKQMNFFNCDVYWGNGGDLDHLLGNLAISAKYFPQCHLQFYTDKQISCYVQNSIILQGVKNKTLSIFPFAQVTIKKTQGLKYPMSDYDMQLHTRQSLRNYAIIDKVQIVADGCYILIISR